MRVHLSVAVDYVLLCLSVPFFVFCFLSLSLPLSFSISSRICLEDSFHLISRNLCWWKFDDVTYSSWRHVTSTNVMWHGTWPDSPRKLFTWFIPAIYLSFYQHFCFLPAGIVISVAAVVEVAVLIGVGAHVVILSHLFWQRQWDVTYASNLID